MRIVITRCWQVNGSTPAKLEAGEVFDVRERTAIYLFAMRCAQRVSEATAGTAELAEPNNGQVLVPGG